MTLNRSAAAAKRFLSCYLLMPLCQGSTRQHQRWLPLVRIRLFLSLVSGVLITCLFYLAVIHNDHYHLIYRQVKLSEDNSDQMKETAVADSIATNASDVIIQQTKDKLTTAATPSSSSFKSSCSRSADERGPHQKVIGFSIYGDLSKKQKAGRYLKPLRVTLKALPSVYPGWIVRIHHNLKKEEHENSSWKILLKAVHSAAAHVDLCNVTEISAKRHLGQSTLTAMLWRWLPLLDDLVDTFMSRDTDSVILTREKNAVDEWLASDRIFHIMRDHPAHCIVMLGGLWGVKLAENRSKITAAFESLFRKEKKYFNVYFEDQKLLNKYIWPLAKTNHMAHDSYCCVKFKGTNTRPFPSQRNALRDFVGQIHQKTSQRIKSPCPHECRPLNIKTEWEYC